MSKVACSRIFLCALSMMFLAIKAEADENKDIYIGVGIPFQGVGIYEDRSQKVNVWNLTPVSAEIPLDNSWSFRFSVYTVYSTPKPKKVDELEFNFEFQRYWKSAFGKFELSGMYAGPMFMLQYHDQDTGAALGGPGISLGYRGSLGDKYWYRIGSYFAYHQYLFGPKDRLRALTGDSLSGGLFMGLTMFEAGTVF